MMLRLLVSAVILANGIVAAQQVGTDTISRGAYVAKALAESRLHGAPLTKDNALTPKITHDVMDNFANHYSRGMTELGVIIAQRSQGDSVAIPDGMDEIENIQVRFVELFPDLNDDALCALSDLNVEFAPSSTFAGLVTFDSHGKQEARLIGKAKRWDSGVNKITPAYTVPPSYKNLLVNDQHTVAGTPKHILYAKWGDIKNRIAFDASIGKRKEDLQLEQDALLQHSN